MCTSLVTLERIFVCNFVRICMRHSVVVCIQILYGCIALAIRPQHRGRIWVRFAGREIFECSKTETEGFGQTQKTKNKV